MESTLITLRTVATLREALAGPRADAAAIGLVPTMGALHDGHLELIHRARAESDIVVVSLFVNPAQFRPGEDLDAYPRDERRDARLAAEAGADILFAPGVEEVYPAGFATTVAVTGVTEVLCGAPDRRGREHFDGVTTVVLKLLNMVGPTAAYFGQKDAQQAIAIRRMARDLDVPARIAVCPTVRERDGLAMSSRDAYLKPAERERAAALYRALRGAADAVARGSRDVDALLAAARAELEPAELDIEYLELRDADDLTPIAGSLTGPSLLAVAARVGRARLIDNVVLSPEDGGKDA